MRNRHDINTFHCKFFQDTYVIDTEVYLYLEWMPDILPLLPYRS